MNERPVYLLGAGGHGRVVLDALLRRSITVVGILDPSMQREQKVFDVPVLGGDDWLDRIDPAAAQLVIGVGADPHVDARRALFLAMRRRGFGFLSVCHDSAVVGCECVLGDGCQVMAGAVLQSRVRLGENTVVNTDASVDHDCVLGAHAFVAPGATLCADVRVGEAAFVGAGAVVLPSIEIGANAIVGAGAVVTGPVTEDLVVAGNPAVRIGANTHE